MTSGLRFHLRYVGLGESELAFVRRGLLERADLGELVYAIWWCNVTFTCPAFEQVVSAYALDFLLDLLDCIEALESGSSTRLILTGSGDTVNFDLTDDWVRVVFDRGSIEVERPELIRLLATSADRATEDVIDRYAVLGGRRDIVNLRKRWVALMARVR